MAAGGGAAAILAGQVLRVLACLQLLGFPPMLLVLVLMEVVVVVVMVVVQLLLLLLHLKHCLQLLLLLLQGHWLEEGAGACPQCAFGLRELAFFPFAFLHRALCTK